MLSGLHFTEELPAVYFCDENIYIRHLWEIACIVIMFQTLLTETVNIDILNGLTRICMFCNKKVIEGWKINMI